MASNRLALQVVMLIVVAFSIGNDVATAQKNKPIDWPKIYFYEGVYELPEQLGKEIPFSLEGYFGLEDAENREQLYLQVFIEYASEKKWFDSSKPVFYTKDASFKNRALIKRIEQFQRYRNQLQDIFREVLRDKDIAYVKKEAKKIDKLLDRYEPAFEKLREAQELPNCYFHYRFSFGPGELSAKQFFASLLRLRSIIDPVGPGLVEDTQTLLYLIADARRLANVHRQDFLQSLEQQLLENVVMPMLDSPKQTEGQLDTLIKMLDEYRQVRAMVDPELEAARLHLISNIDVYHALRDKRYQTEPKSVPPQYDEAREIMQLFNRMSSGTSMNWTAQRLRFRWQRSKRPAEEIQEMTRFADRLEKAKGAEGHLGAHLELQRVFANLVRQMKPADFDADIELLKKRYEFIEQACAADFPESTQLLRQVTNAWLANDDWLNSPILLWSLMRQQPARATSLSRLNAHLGLAVVKKWRLAHGGKNPESLDEAVAHAGIKDILLDPFSGESLKYRNTRSGVEIYSVGFNGNDDHPIMVHPNAQHATNEFLYSLDAVAGEVKEGNFYYFLKLPRDK